MVRLVQASKDENGRYSGGLAGNQSGGELNLRTWYSRPWDTVLRPISASLGEQIANVAQVLAKCRQIGYDQGQRTTLYDECEKIEWDITKLNTIKPCECDCSSLIPVILRFCGVSIPKTAYTGNLSSYLMRTGQFICLRSAEYLTGDAYIRKGDFLLNTAHHVATAIDNGAKAVETFKAYAANVNVKTYLQVRTAPGGAEFRLSDGQSFRLPPGMTVAIIEEVNGWGRLSNIAGWVSLAYLSRQ